MLSTMPLAEWQFRLQPDFYHLTRSDLKVEFRKPVKLGKFSESKNDGCADFSANVSKSADNADDKAGNGYPVDVFAVLWIPRNRKMEFSKRCTLE